MIFAFIFSLVFIGAVTVIGVMFYKRIMSNIKDDKESEKRIPTTQDNLPIDYVRDGIVKARNGKYSSVVALPSINIDLMETDEKEVVFAQYFQVLSAIDFPFQFLEQTRVVDISDYLKNLHQMRFETSNKFIQKQIDFYSDFLNELVQTKSIFTRKFYIVVSYDIRTERANSKNKSSLFDLSITGKKREKIEEDERQGVIEEERNFNLAREELFSRVRTVENLFKRFDIRPERLLDDELVELLYTFYNKNRSLYQPLGVGAIRDRTTLFVKKGRVR